MSNFYARFIPAKPNGQSNGTNGTKRKPEQDLANESKRPRSKPEKPVVVTQNFAKRFQPSKKVSEPDAPISNGGDILAKYSVSGAARRKDKEVDVRYRKPVKEKTVDVGDTNSEVNETIPKNRKKERRNKEAQVSVEEEQGDQKHTGVREKFEKAKKQSEEYESNLQDEEDLGTNDSSMVELHGLEPLPQPPVVEESNELPTYSTLPPWLGKPTHISPDMKSNFKTLGIGPEMTAKLKTEGIEEALPIQAAVIPILLERLSRYNGDIAVSAATGSGKTLSYVLPIVEDLKDLTTMRFRGLIVVPTRELVKQVQETLNFCASGTKLRVATALGSKSIKDEADMLVESYEIFDPKAYEEKQKKQIDWTNLSLSELFESAKEDRPSNYVKRYRSKFDILVCTPGRLVEHLRSTKGFSLDHVRWLVIDEVDRLLNESYQEWVEVVMPALDSREATKLRDEILREVKIDLPPRLIRKVILSATMTKDVSKLSSLKLRNPKLLVLEGEILQVNTNSADAEQQDTVPHEAEVFQLPGTLAESAVLVGDGSDKPLHLLELLQARIKGQKEVLQEDSEFETSSSDSSNDSTSESDGDSDTSSSVSSSDTPQISTSAQTSKSKSSLPSTLIFTRSSEAAPRLSRLLSLLSPDLAPQIATLTRSTTSSATSRKALKSFREGKVSILITTDRAARGLDIPDIRNVISYDIPTSTQFYVHRVGRTARAGKVGHAWTLLAHREARWFWNEIGKEETAIGRGGRKVAKVTLEGLGKDSDMKRYADALEQLGEEVRTQ